MNLEPYFPFSDRMVVYHSSEDILNQIDGIVSTFLLALMNDYQFNIGNLSETKLHEIFTSPVDWWNNTWFVDRSKRGLWNLKFSTPEDEFALSNILLWKKFPYSQVIHVYANENLISFIMNNESYKEKIEKYEIKPEDNIYKEIFKNIFFGFEKNWEENFQYLKQNFFSDENRMVARIISSNQIDNLVEKIRETNPQKVLLSTNDISIVNQLKQTFKDVQFLYINDIKNDEYSPTILTNVKLFYELLLFIDTNNKFLESNDKFSEIVNNCTIEN